MRLNRMLWIGCVMILAMSAYSSAAYVAGTVWDFQTMFSTSSNLGQTDSEGNTVWEYRYVNWDGDPRSSGGLMGVYHAWESPATWQKAADRTYDAQIATDRFQVSSGWEESAALVWVAPTDGLVNVSISMTGRDGPNAAWLTIWPANESAVTATEVWMDWSWSMSNLAVSQGDKIAIRMNSWGSGWVRFGNPDMTVTLVTPEPATLGLLAIGGLGVLIRRKQ